MNEGTRNTKRILGTVLCVIAILILLLALLTFPVAFQAYRFSAHSKQVRIAEQTAINAQIKDLYTQIQRFKTNKDKPEMKRPLMFGESRVVPLSGKRTISVSLHKPAQWRMYYGEMKDLDCVIRSDEDSTKRMNFFSDESVDTTGGDPCIDKKLTITFYRSREDTPAVEYLQNAANLVADLLQNEIISQKSIRGENESRYDFFARAGAEVGVVLLAAGICLVWMGRRLRRTKPV